jgi:hypothetical protein
MNRRKFLVSLGLAPVVARSVVENNEATNSADAAKYVEYTRKKLVSSETFGFVEVIDSRGKKHRIPFLT